MILRDRRNSKRKSMPFTIAMVWKERKDHFMDSYMINLKGINRKKKHHVQYPDVRYAIRFFPHGPDLPVPETDGKMEYCCNFERCVLTVVDGGWCIQTRRGWPASTLETSRTQRPEPFKGVCSAARFMSQRETFVVTKNSALFLSRPWERIKTFFHVQGLVIIGL